MLGATTCTGWNDDPSERCTNEMPAFESRRVRTQPFTVTAESFGAAPARISRTLKAVSFMRPGLLRRYGLVQLVSRGRSLLVPHDRTRPTSAGETCVNTRPEESGADP